MLIPGSESLECAAVQYISFPTEAATRYAKQNQYRQKANTAGY